MIDMIIEARTAAIGPHMKVKRILPFRLRRMVGPFIFMDHAGPVADLPPNISSMDVLPHPHIGISTVSYLFGGTGYAPGQFGRGANYPSRRGKLDDGRHVA